LDAFDFAKYLRGDFQEVVAVMSRQPALNRLSWYADGEAGIV
jgi:hypothetical protein